MEQKEVIKPKENQIELDQNVQKVLDKIDTIRKKPNEMSGIADFVALHLKAKQEQYPVSEQDQKIAKSWGLDKCDPEQLEYILGKIQN